MISTFVISAEPMKEVQQLRTGDAGEEILVASGEAGHFVREDGPQDEGDVASVNAGVDPHGHVKRESPLGNLRSLRRRELTQSAQRRVAIPIVVEDFERAVAVR